MKPIEILKAAYHARVEKLIEEYAGGNISLQYLNEKVQEMLGYIAKVEAEDKENERGRIKAEVDKYRHEVHSLLDILNYLYNYKKKYNCNIDVIISYIENKIERCREKMESLTGNKFAFEIGIEADLTDIERVK